MPDPAPVEAAMVTAIAAGCTELAGRITPAIRPEGDSLPWGTYEMREERYPSSLTVLVLTTMELTIWHAEHDTARQWAARLAAFFEGTAAEAKINGQTVVVQQSSSTAQVVDDGGPDSERAVTLFLQVGQEQTR